MNIHLTGCHHSCAQHYIGDIGLLACKVAASEDGDTVAPLVEYEAGDKLYRVHGAPSARTSRKIGDQMPVLYKRHLPSKGVVDTFHDRWAIPLALGGAGLVMMAVGYLVWRGARRRRRVLESAARAAGE